MKRNQASAKSAEVLRTILRERGDVNALSLAFQNIEALATAPAIAARFHKSPSSIYRWKRAGRAIAFRPRGAKRYLFPLAQFTNRGIAAWAKDIIKAVGNGTTAFHFLMVGRESLRGESYSARILKGDSSVAANIGQTLSMLEIE